MASPARDPAARSVLASLTGFSQASAWKVTLYAPASAYPGAQRSGSVIIRCTSNGIAVVLRRLCTTGRPIVRFGTKWLSITSTCTQSAAPSMACTAVARCAKSAARMLGAMIGDDSTAEVYGLSAVTRDTPGVQPSVRRRGTAVLLAVLLAAGCSGAPPDGTD